MFTLLIMSLLFTAACCAALIIRKTIFSERGAKMYVLWIIILLLCAVPIKIGNSIYSDENSNNENNISDLGNSENYDFPADYNSQENQSDWAQEEIPKFQENYKNNLQMFFETIMSAVSAENLEIICAVLFILWLAGLSFTLTTGFCEYFSSDRALRKFSYSCEIEKINTLIKSCADTVKLKKSVNIRIMKSDGICSPCVSGFFKPAIYISPELCNYSDEKLTHVIMHEMYHVKYRDIIFKTTAMLITAVYWFIPIRSAVLTAIYEDCEFMCDCRVIKNPAVSGYKKYMNTLIDIAEIYSENTYLTAKNERNITPNISGNSGYKFLKRRYENMKNTRTRFSDIIISAVFVTVLLVSNIFFASSCAISAADAADYDEMPSAIEEAIRAYYGLTPKDKITSEMIAGVEDIVIVKNLYGYDKISTGTDADGNPIYNTSKTLLDVYINGKTFSGPLPETVRKDYFESVYFENIPAESDDYPILFSYYTLKDPNDPELDPQKIAEMKMKFPDTADGSSFYIVDPETKEREAIRLLQILYNYGLLEKYTIGGTTFDASSLSIFPNLKSFTYSGIDVINADESAYSVNEVEYTPESKPSFSSKAIPGLANLIDKSLRSPEEIEEMMNNKNQIAKIDN